MLGTILSILLSLPCYGAGYAAGKTETNVLGDYDLVEATDTCVELYQRGYAVAQDIEPWW